ncbi:hypothetical protein [Marmoricola sp. RAF53]|uniref:hypothetical protein n=1 Tax=Marmoricola sp. RAF53 TaxID=3233059 RepID=UPI003F9AC03F
MFNFNWAIDHNQSDLEQIHASVWHETGHWISARLVGAEHETALDPTQKYPRITHDAPEIQAQLDAMPFVVDAMAILADMAAYQAAAEGVFRPDISHTVFEGIDVALALRFDQGFGCSRGCSGPNELLKSTGWLDVAVEVLIPHWPDIALHAVRLWNYRFSPTFSTGCPSGSEIHVCAQFEPADG